jgi:acyl carrier protein
MAFVNGTDQEIEQRVKNILMEMLGADEREVGNSARTLRDDLGADSIDDVEVAMALEEEFNIEIPDEIAEKWVTIQDVVDYLVAHPLRAGR